MNRTKLVKKASPPWRHWELIVISSESNNEWPKTKRLSRNKSNIIKIVGDTQRNQWYFHIYKTNVYQIAKYSNAISQTDFQYFSKKMHYISSNNFFHIKVVRAKFENMTFLWTPLQWLKSWLTSSEWCLIVESKFHTRDATSVLPTWKWNKISKFIFFNFYFEFKAHNSTQH